MTITSTFFIFLFLPLVLLGYYLIRRELGNLFLVATSLLFYALSDPGSVWLLVLSIAVNYALGLALELADNWAKKTQKAKNGSGGGSEYCRKILLILGLIFNFGLLFYYKYFIFSIETVNSLFGLDFEIPVIGLPLGISFFTFRTVSYLLDIYWRTVPTQKNPIDAALYVSFFPQVTMGPITKYSDFSKQLNERKFDLDSFGEGLKNLVTGLFKKVVFANPLGIIVNHIFSMPHTSRTVGLAWIGIIGYLLQLYYDFSGYSDMAIGLGKLFGFHTPRNFEYPYLAKSVADFWNRWHMTLGTWLKDYIYTPVFRAMQKKKKLSLFGCNIVALFATWLFSGAWHGSAWHYIAMGLYYFAFIAFERTVEDRQKKRRKRLGLKKQPETRLHAVIAHVYCFFAVVFGQLMFRIEGFWNFFPYAAGMFYGNLSSPLTELIMRDSAATFLIGIVFCYPILPKLKEYFSSKYTWVLKAAAAVEPFVYTLMLIIAVAYSMNSSYDPFLYNNF